ncbi:hypothetical protein MSKOL_2935 [Methanosarcina sp. Kolksee]|uniref:hypothetical protein n=1 Tax=Methanosarcina sp. Kolksee TaxID=1434099 RepID=UPI0006161797|nr:hypothetical protein [Methanosarcina sp. Kolksee]AKB48712.1 hypothetical protein MSKOL_2935 [Methanosarcina sp. Kolksee]
MFKFGSEEVINDLSVFSDDEEWDTFYILPKTPNFRLDSEGKPVFQFLKYRTEIDRSGEFKAGGIAFFDVALQITDDKQKAVKEELQKRVDNLADQRNAPHREVKIEKIKPIEGGVSVNLTDMSNNLVEKAWNPASPSLYGDFITPITVEFTKDGAALFWNALQGKGGSVQVSYSFVLQVGLPPITAYCHWDAQKFYSFYQTITVDENWCADDNYYEYIRERFHNSEFYTTEFDFRNLKDTTLQNEIRESIQRTFDDAIARNIIKENTPVSDENRKVPDDMEHVTRTMITNKTSSVTVNYTEGMTMEWDPHPGGTLPNITNLPGVDPKDYFKEIDLDDPFFKTLTVPIYVNADFDNLPIYSVEVHIDYNEGETHKIDEFMFKSPNDVSTFRTFIENNNWKYNYWYQVNYKFESKSYISDIKQTDEKNLVINVDDIGILHVNIQPGHLDFSKIPQVEVAIQYEDRSAGVDLIEEVFMLDKDSKNQEMLKVIFQPRRNQYRYRVKYYMADGKEYLKDWTSAQSEDLLIGSPFVDKVIHIRPVGDMDNDIANIYIDLKYEDTGNDYRTSQSYALNKANPFADWVFPVVSETGGKVTYSGMIQYKNGDLKEIPPTEVKTDSIYPGDYADMLQVQVFPDLIDFSIVKLAKVSLSYQDPENGIVERKDVIIKPDSENPVDWSVKLKDKNKNAYQWQATFFMKDGSTRKTDLVTTSDLTVLPEAPVVLAPPIN